MIRSFKNTTPSIGENSYIDESAVVIGDVVIGENCSVWPLTVIRGDINKIRIGDNTNIQDGSVLHVTHRGEHNPDGAELHIGNEVTIGPQSAVAWLPHRQSMPDRHGFDHHRQRDNRRPGHHRLGQPGAAGQGSRIRISLPWKPGTCRSERSPSMRSSTCLTLQITMFC